MRLDEIGTSHISVAVFVPLMVYASSDTRRQRIGAGQHPGGAAVGHVLRKHHRKQRAIGPMLMVQKLDGLCEEVLAV